jgi:hypothetical protein
MNEEEKAKIDSLFDRIYDLESYMDDNGLLHNDDLDKLFTKIAVAINKIDSNRGIDEKDLITDEDIEWP